MRDKVIGDMHRKFCDFGLDMPIADLPEDSRLKNPALGAGSLLDIDIYSITWGILTLEDLLKGPRPKPVIHSAQTLSDGVDISTSMLFFYPNDGGHGLLSSTTRLKTEDSFCRWMVAREQSLWVGRPPQCPTLSR
jgi:hypothetical protein